MEGRSELMDSNEEVSYERSGEDIQDRDNLEHDTHGITKDSSTREDLEADLDNFDDSTQVGPKTGETIQHDEEIHMGGAEDEEIRVDAIEDKEIHADVIEDEEIHVDAIEDEEIQVDPTQQEDAEHFEMEIYFEKEDGHDLECPTQETDLVSINGDGEEQDSEGTAEETIQHDEEIHMDGAEDEEIRVDAIEDKEIHADVIEDEEILVDAIEDEKIQVDPTQQEDAEHFEMEIYFEKEDGHDLECPTQETDPVSINCDGEEQDSEGAEDEEIRVDAIEDEEIRVDAIEDKEIHADAIEDEEIHVDAIEDEEIQVDPTQQEDAEHFDMEIYLEKEDGHDLECPTQETDPVSINGDGEEQDSEDGDEDEDGELSYAREVARTKFLENPKRRVLALAEQRYHLPNNNCCQDWFQVSGNNDPCHVQSVSSFHSRAMIRFISILQTITPCLEYASTILTVSVVALVVLHLLCHVRSCPDCVTIILRKIQLGAGCALCASLLQSFSDWQSQMHFGYGHATTTKTRHSSRPKPEQNSDQT